MIRNVILNGIADVVSMLAGVLASIVFARQLGPEEWGLYSQILWLVGIVGVLLNLGMNFVAIRYLGAMAHSGERRDREQLVLLLFLIQVLLNSFVVIIVYFNLDFVASILGWNTNDELLKLALLSLFVYTLVQLGVSAVRGLQMFQVLVEVSIINLVLIVAEVAVIYRLPSANSLVLLSTLAHLVILCWLITRVGRALTPVRGLPLSEQIHMPERAHDIFAYAGAVFVATLFDQIVWQRSEMLFLGQLPDASQSAFYSIGYNITQVGLGTAAGAITGTLVPSFSARVGSGDSAGVTGLHKRVFAYLIVMLVPMVLGLFVLARPMMAVLYGDRYLAASPVLQLLSISTALGILVRPSAAILHAINRPRVLIASSLLALPFDIGLAWFFIPRYGAIGAAAANLCAQLIGASVTVGMSSKAAKLGYDTGSLFRSLAAGCITACLMEVAVWLSLPSTPVGLIVTFLGGVALYSLMMLAMRDGPVLEAVQWAGARLSNRLREAC